MAQRALHSTLLQTTPTWSSLVGVWRGRVIQSPSSLVPSTKYLFKFELCRRLAGWCTRKYLHTVVCICEYVSVGLGKKALACLLYYFTLIRFLFVLTRSYAANFQAIILLVWSSYQMLSMIVGALARWTSPSLANSVREIRGDSTFKPPQHLPSLINYPNKTSSRAAELLSSVSLSSSLCCLRWRSCRRRWLYRSNVVKVIARLLAAEQVSRHWASLWLEIYLQHLRTY